MQNLKEPEPKEPEVATAKDSSPPNGVSKGKDPEFSGKVDRWTEELVENLNRNAKQRTPTS